MMPEPDASAAQYRPGFRIDLVGAKRQYNGPASLKALMSRPPRQTDYLALDAAVYRLEIVRPARSAVPNRCCSLGHPPTSCTMPMSGSPSAKNRHGAPTGR